MALIFRQAYVVSVQLSGLFFTNKQKWFRKVKNVSCLEEILPLKKEKENTLQT